MEIILSIGSFTAFIFAFVLFNKQGKLIADKILTVWMIAFGIDFLSVLLSVWLVFPGQYFWIALASLIFISHFPILFFYSESLTIINFSWSRKYKSHVLFMIVIYAIGVIPFTRMNNEELYTFAYTFTGYSALKIFMASVYLLTAIFYLFKTYRAIQKHKSSIKNIYSYEEKINLIWVQRIVWVFAILFLLNLITIIFLFFNKITIASTDYIMYLALIIIVFYIGYQGFKQGHIFHQPTDFYQTSQKNKQNTYVNTPYDIRTPSLKDFQERLHEIMETKKPFLDPKLSLFDLSKVVDISSKELSTYLNREMDMNFYEFINRYRVKEVKAKLETDGEKYTLLSIALDCGFNSKASFNRIFKQITGFTPSEYKLHKRASH